MRRVLVFVLLGPFLVWLTFILWHVPEAISKPLPSDFGFLSAFLLAAYILAAVPALALAGLDELMARRGTMRLARVAACAAIGYAAIVGFIYLVAPALGVPGELAKQWPALGVLGGIPAAVCAWLSGNASVARQPNGA